MMRTSEHRRTGPRVSSFGPESAACGDLGFHSSPFTASKDN
jgi:hypothetical protein